MEKKYGKDALKQYPLSENGLTVQHKGLDLYPNTFIFSVDHPAPPPDPVGNSCGIIGDREWILDCLIVKMKQDKTILDFFMDAITRYAEKHQPEPEQIPPFKFPEIGVWDESDCRITYITDLQLKYVERANLGAKKSVVDARISVLARSKKAANHELKKILTESPELIKLIEQREILPGHPEYMGD